MQYCNHLKEPILDIEKNILLLSNFTGNRKKEQLQAYLTEFNIIELTRNDTA